MSDGAIDAAGLFEAAPDGLLLVDGRGIVIRANESACAMFGWQRSALVGRELATLIPGGHRPAHLANVERWFAEPARRPMASRMRLLALHASGASFPVEISLNPVSSGGQVFALAAVRDVTENERLRSDLALRERQAGLGLLAASLAHEINNPLAAIQANLELALEVQGPGAADEMLADAREGCQRVAAIVSDLLTLSRDSREESEKWVELAQAVQSALRLAGPHLRRVARIEVDVRPGIRVRCAPGRLLHVLTNLLANAARDVGAVGREAALIRVSAVVGEGTVRLTVRDNGTGIPPEVRDRLFHPFTTSHPEDGGTGLGLYYSRRILEEVGGGLEVDSGAGGGATFIVTLPAA